MATLILNAPTWRENEDGAKTFESMLATGVADGYAIASTLVGRLSPGCAVVVLNKEKGQRAEGTLLRLQPAGMTKSGIQRYNVHIAGLRCVRYCAELLNRCGVAVK